jgi:hypothetical protein
MQEGSLQRSNNSQASGRGDQVAQEHLHEDAIYDREGETQRLADATKDRSKMESEGFILQISEDFLHILQFVRKRLKNYSEKTSSLHY